MTNKWEYGGSYLGYPVIDGCIVFNDGSIVQTHDIFDPIPRFMTQADLMFIDPPWSIGNMKSFYTKAGLVNRQNTFECFYKRLFVCIADISPTICYVEVGKEYLAEFILEMKRIYRVVTFYNSTYYHSQKNCCYVVRGSNKREKINLDGIDEENIISWICENENYECIGDLCIGRGLVGVNAYRNGRRFVGTELNHKRLSVLVEAMVKLGATYTISLIQ